MTEYLTTAEVAELYQCSVATIRRRVKDGTLGALRLTSNGPLRYDVANLPLEGNIMIKRRSDKSGWPYVFAGRHTNPHTGKTQEIKKKCPDKNPGSRTNKLFETELIQSLIDKSYWEKGRRDPTLNEYVPRLLAHLKAKRRSASYMQHVKGVLDNHLIEAFGNIALRRIDSEMLDDFTSKRDHLAPKTVNNFLGVLSKLCHLAVKDGKLAVVPDIEKLEEDEPKIPFLTEDEADALIAACDGKLRVMVILALWTGVRVGELLAIKWDDIDLRRGELTVARQYCQTSKRTTPTKGKAARTIPLPSHVVAELRSWSKVRMLHCELVFPVQRGKTRGKIARKENTQRALYRACKRAGLKSFGWHRLRHTYASWLVQRGANIYRVQELMGHKTLAQTERYAKHNKGSLREAVDVLELDATHMRPTGTGSKFGK